MFYLIMNAILIGVLGLIYFLWQKENNGLFAALVDFLLAIYGKIICPTIISILNVCANLGHGDYSYIKFSLIPLILPLFSLIKSIAKEKKYHYIYNKYHIKVSKYAKEFLFIKGVEEENIHINTTYANNSRCKESEGKVQCCVHAYIYNKDVDAYTLSKEIPNYLESIMPDVFFTAYVERKSKKNK